MVPAHPVICVVGPTAAGKSALALKLAQEFRGEIVNADSRQFYRELSIGTAKPTLEELAIVPHHLVDCAAITAPWDVAMFVSQAHAALSDIAARGKVAIVAGGTGMYVRALLHGLAVIPEIPDELRQELRHRMASEGRDALYAALKNRDPQGAQRLSPSDTQRILRALEVVIHTQKPIHEFWQSNTKALFPNLVLGLNPERGALYAAINARVDAMMCAGLKAEAMGLWREFPDNPVLAKTIGYAEWHEFGFAPEDEAKAVAAIRANSRHFAKRQITWFGKQAEILWLPREFAGAQQIALEKVEKFLALS